MREALEFNFFYSLPFWAAFLLVALSSLLLGRRGGARKISLLVFSGLLLTALPNFSVSFLVILSGLVAFSYLAGSLLNREGLLQSRGARRSALVLGLAVVIAFLFVFKYPSIQRALSLGVGGQAASSGFLFFIGVSYFTFKMVHFLVESSKRKIESPDALTYANYILFFPSFISGPINRYNHFASQLNGQPKPATGEDWKVGAERIVNGLFKKFVLVQLLYPKIQELQSAGLSMPSGPLVVGLYAYALYFYLDFSAYSDLAIGSARILGIELPENFNGPFFKKNIRELWTNWHMSLTSWLVDYIYWPIVRNLRNLGFFRSHPVFLSNMGMIITFIVCGAWHGEALNFIIWGAYHGLGISAMTIYQREKRKVKSELAQRYFRSKLSRFAGVFFTFNFFVFGLAFFLFDMDELRTLMSRLW